MTKNANISISFYFAILYKNTRLRLCVFCIFVFCVITFVTIKIYNHYAPQSDRLNLSFVKDKHVFGKKMTIYGLKMAIYQLPFFGVHRTCMQPQATSEAITFETIKI